MIKIIVVCMIMYVFLYIQNMYMYIYTYFTVYIYNIHIIISYRLPEELTVGLGLNMAHYYSLWMILRPFGWMLVFTLRLGPSDDQKSFEHRLALGSECWLYSLECSMNVSVLWRAEKAVS